MAGALRRGRLRGTVARQDAALSHSASGSLVAERVVALTLADPPGETTHWTADMMAQAAGISASAVRRIWKAHGLQPNRWRQFKLSNDPQFVDKLRDVVGLYVDPPAHAIVLSVDEKSQIQALAVPAPPGRPWIWRAQGRAGPSRAAAAPCRGRIFAIRLSRRSSAGSARLHMPSIQHHRRRFKAESRSQTLAGAQLKSATPQDHLWLSAARRRLAPLPHSSAFVSLLARSCPMKIHHANTTLLQKHMNSWMTVLLSLA